MALLAADGVTTQKLRAQVKWLRESAAGTKIDKFKWLMDGLANELEQIAQDLEKVGAEMARAPSAVSIDEPLPDALPAKHRPETFHRSK